MRNFNLTHARVHHSNSIRELQPVYKAHTHNRGAMKGQRKKHDHLFWHPATCIHGKCFGNVTGAKIKLRLISLLMLVIAAYVAILAKLVARVVTGCHSLDLDFNPGVSAVLLLLALLPIGLCGVQVREPKCAVPVKAWVGDPL